MMAFDMEDPRWTAYVLGELDDADRAQLQRILEDSADARAYVASLRETIGVIERELQAVPPPPALDDLQRKRIAEAAKVRPSRLRWWIAGGATATAAAGLAFVVFSSSQAGHIHAQRVVVARGSTLSSGDQNSELDNLVVAESTIARGSAAHSMSGSGYPAMVASDAGAVALQSNFDHRGARIDIQAQGSKNQPLFIDGHTGLKVDLPQSTSDPNTAFVLRGQHEQPGTEAYDHIADNPFFTTRKEPLSTFSIDVDTAAYANLRRFLSEGSRPPKDAVRIEEMLNYFSYDYPQPERGEPFSITTEVGPSPWHGKHQLVRIGLQAADIDAAQVPARNLVFLIDTSGSMQPANKLPLLVQSMGLLVDNLRPQDKVSIVVYAGAAGLVLPPTSGREKDAIRNALARLEAGGSTNGGAGIQLAYETAARTFIKGGINRVILCSDGDYNVGITSEGDLTRLIEKERRRGVFLTVLGFGMGNFKDATMEKLADKGNGNYAYIDSLFEARKVLVKEAGATLVTVAKDVKLQIEFNPATVAGHRLIGYENRVLAHQDFNDDKKDAGEIGAGHAVTALYEIVPAGVGVPSGGKVDDLKYQTPALPGPASASGELLTVKVRYKAPNGDTSKLLSRVVTGSSAWPDLTKTSTDFRWAAAIAGFGMLLRESPHRGNLTWQQVQALAAGAVGNDDEGYRKQAIAMIAAASRLKSPSP